MDKSFRSWVLEVTASVIRYFVVIAEEPWVLDRLLTQLGVFTATFDRVPVVRALRALGTALRDLERLREADVHSLSSVQQALQAIRTAAGAVQAIGQSGLDEYKDLGLDLLEVALIGALRSGSELAWRLAQSLGVVRSKQLSPVLVNGQAVRIPLPREGFDLGALLRLLSDPVAVVLEGVPAQPLSNTANARLTMDVLVERFGGVLDALGIQCVYGLPAQDARYLGAAAPYVDHALSLRLPQSLARDTELGIGITLSPADGEDLGIIVAPTGSLNLQRRLGDWNLSLALNEDAQAFAFGGGQGFKALGTATRLQAALRANRVSLEGPALLIGAADGTRLELGALQFAAALAVSASDTAIDIELQAERGTFALVPADTDGFLGSLLPSDGIRVDFDAGLAWSNKQGLTLKGSAGLEATIPVGRSFAGISLASLYLGLQARDAKITAEVSATFAAALGPVKAVLDRVGIAAQLSFPDRGGNLGVADVDLGFKPPSTIGLSVDAQGVITGGGSLGRDPVHGTYFGMMQVSLREQLTLKAFGLIATRMPDGSRGYSLIIFITAEDFLPIPLGLGFTLLGIGGMLAVHRSFDVGVLRQGLRNNTLGALLFPRDPVSNAPAILRALESAFPARRGSYLLGLLVRIGWFTPTLVHFDLALILEFGTRKRLLVLGRISSLLPTADNDLLRLNLDSVGVLDFDQGTVEIDALLVDSRLIHKFVLTGAMALRARFGSGPGSAFILAVGGWHPRFAAPAGVPRLERVGIALSSGDNPRLTCEAYFAITSNTLQFGARAQLYARAIGFSIEGDVGFDVLIERSPLHFLAEFHASVQLKHGSRNLFKVTLRGQLEGPRPLRISGKATFEILWCDFSVRVDKTLVNGEKPPLPPAINVLAQLQQALANPQSWSTQAPANTAHGVALRRLAPGTPLVLDPLGRLAVKQSVVPLNTGEDVELFGGSPVQGERRFSVQVTVNQNATQVISSVRDSFAPAQYFHLSEAEKLSGPSFDEYDAGFVVGTDAVSFDAAQGVANRLAYKNINTDAPTLPNRPQAPYMLPATHLSVGTGAAARAGVRKVGVARFRNVTAKPAVQLQAPRWQIRPITGGPPATVDPGVKTWSEHRTVVKALNRVSPRWQVVPTYEVPP